MTFIELLAWSVWDYVRPRKVLTMLLVGLAGPLFALLLRWRMPGNEYSGDVAYGIVAPMAVYSFTLILLSVVFASGIVSSEMVGKTIQFLLTRPIPRYKILLAKWLAAVLVVSVATMLSCLATAFVAYGPNFAQGHVFRDLWVIPIGALSYCSLFTFLSVVSTKPWMFAISFGFLWESWVPLLPGDFQKLSIMAHLRALSPQVETSGSRGIVEFLRLLSPETITTSTAWNTLIFINVVAIAVACAIFSTAEFVPKEEAA